MVGLGCCVAGFLGFVVRIPCLQSGLSMVSPPIGVSDESRAIPPFFYYFFFLLVSTHICEEGLSAVSPA